MWAIDKNGDGMLSSSELSGYLSDFGLTDESIEQLQVKLMMHFDTDGNDQIDLDEFVSGYAMWQQLQAQLDELSAKREAQQAAQAPSAHS